MYTGQIAGFKEIESRFKKCCFFMLFQLEVCCFNLLSAQTAQKAGAHRIELCADPHDGGTTPSLGTIKASRERLSIPLYPIIRPRGGDFLYSDQEFEMMLSEVVLCRQLNCDGIVTGILNPDGTVDKKRTGKLVEWAYPMEVSFHRAFDWTKDPFESLEDIINIGCERILTSGQRPLAAQGASLIGELIRQAGNRIILMPGSGLRAHNIIELAEKTGASEFHSSARRENPGQMKFQSPGMQMEPKIIMADQAEIESMVSLLSKHFEVPAIGSG
jgi:copper homeostasis protein